MVANAVIPGLRRQGQEDCHQLEASLGFTVGPCLKNKDLSKPAELFTVSEWRERTAGTLGEYEMAEL